jgi:hypothetical protein
VGRSVKEKEGLGSGPVKYQIPRKAVRRRTFDVRPSDNVVSPMTMIRIEVRRFARRANSLVAIDSEDQNYPGTDICPP